MTALSAKPTGGYALVTTTGTTYSYGAGGAGSTTSGLALGMSVPSLVGASSSQTSSALAAMSGIGLRWVRIEADWSWIQAGGPSSFDWSATDQAVALAAAAGMSVDLVIDNTPTWAAPAGSAAHSFTQPTSAATYAVFAGQVAAHYGPMGVHTYEIWNEPNIQPFWLPAPNPGYYAAMLRYAYATIKAAQPGATVISAGLSPASTDGTNVNAVDFLTDLYADGAGSSFDAVGYHAYSYPALPNTYESWSGWSQMGQTTPSIRSVMTANGDSAKQIWITEVGAPSAGPDGVGTAAQAQEVSQAVTAARTTSWIGGLFVYTYQDSATAPDYFGLLNADGSQKPAWAALAAALG